MIQKTLVASFMFYFKNKYKSFIIDQHNDIVSLLTKLTSLKPPIDHVLELLPRLQARYYSISSSPKVFHLFNCSSIFIIYINFKIPFSYTQIQFI